MPPVSARLRGAVALSCATVLLLVFAAGAGAATRSWVSGVGDDVNPCSITAPCKTLAGAISKTDAGGEIDALDPAGYGTVTITKAITIDFSNTLGSVLDSGTHGIVINAPAADVVLRGLSIDGGRTGSGGCPMTALNGVWVREAGTVRIEDSKILAQSLAGIAITPAASDPKIFVSGSSISDNCGNGITAAPTGGHAVSLMVTGTSVFNSGTAFSVNSGVTSWLQGSTITGNTVGLEHLGSGTIDSYADNVIAGNGSDGAATTQRTLKGDAGAAGATGATGATGTSGPIGPTGATGPAAFKLVVAPLATTLRARAGAKVKVKYVATADAKATLTVTKGTKKVAMVTGAALSGANAITWTSKVKGKAAAKGTYRLALRVVSADGQVATTKATAKLS